MEFSVSKNQSDLTLLPQKNPYLLMIQWSGVTIVIYNIFQFVTNGFLLDDSKPFDVPFAELEPQGFILIIGKILSNISMFIGGPIILFFSSEKSGRQKKVNIVSLILFVIYLISNIAIDVVLLIVYFGGISLKGSSLPLCLESQEKVKLFYDVILFNLLIIIFLSPFTRYYIKSLKSPKACKMWMSFSGLENLVLGLYCTYPFLNFYVFPPDNQTPIYKTTRVIETICYGIICICFILSFVFTTLLKKKKRRQLLGVISFLYLLILIAYSIITFQNINESEKDHNVTACMIANVIKEFAVVLGFILVGLFPYYVNSKLKSHKK